VRSGPAGFEEAFGGRFAEAGEGEPAAPRNWIKAYPCCLQTHSPIEAAQTARATAGAEAAPVTVVVHPRARQAAPYDDVEDGLQAKFSIPYTVAYTLLYGVPSAPSCFSAVDEAARALAREHVRVRVDEALPETGAQLELGGEPVAKVETATGSPSRPMTDEQLAAKVSMLGAGHLRSMLESPDAPARDLAAAALERLWKGRIS